MPFGLKLGKSDEEKLQEAIFNCRMSSKQLEKAAKKTEPKEAAEKLKCKEYILAGQMDMASIHAQNAIRHRSEGTRNLQMASRLQAAEGRLKHALTMKSVMPKMARATGAMTSAMGSMNLEAITGVMNKFEETTGKLDVMTGVMDDGISQGTATLTPQSEVDKLLNNVATEHKIEDKLAAITAPKTGLPSVAQPAQPSEAATDRALEEKLAALRNTPLM